MERDELREREETFRHAKARSRLRLVRRFRFFEKRKRRLVFADFLPGDLVRRNLPLQARVARRACQLAKVGRNEICSTR